MLRAYHNPDVREGTWTKMFDRRLPAVVPMDHAYLARYDGSELAQGRGMGIEKRLDIETKERFQGPGRTVTPYMHMAFHPLERRLDTAIFRALFASSTRQARQFVTHGWVKVNGKKMKHPSYLLNPGDMFSVDPERVMFATGARKEVAEKEQKDEDAEAAEDAESDAPAEETSTTAQSETTEIASASGESVQSVQAEPVEVSAETKSEAKKALRALVEKTRSILEDARDQLSGKRQRELRDLSKDVKKLLSKYRGTPESELDETIEGMQANLAEILGKVPHGTVPTPESAAPANDSNKPSNPQAQDPEHIDNYKIAKDAKLLAAALERVRENPYDPSKPYATPWAPRDYMSAFAFIPRYLEVNQNICSAVYVRHPVARPGLAEVPTPFSAETMALGFNWYLRRR
jgi:ribosomal protein S4